MQEHTHLHVHTHTFAHAHTHAREGASKEGFWRFKFFQQGKEQIGF